MTNKYSKEHELFLKKKTREKRIILSVQIIIFLSILALWELLTQINVLDSFFISSPSRIVKTLINLFGSGTMLNHIWTTLYETILGFSISMILGITFALAFWWSDRLRKILDPYLVVLNSMPKIALGPLIIVWIGSGTKAIVAMCILICVFVATLSILSAFLSVEKEKIMLMKSMGASKWQMLIKLILPSSIPDLISVLKITVGLSWIGTIMGEYLTSKAGLGYLIVYGGQVFKLDLVMASTFILCVLALIMYFLVASLERKIKKN
ncbi:MAG: ABC transporter permease [Clostridia bacterium]